MLSIKGCFYIFYRQCWVSGKYRNLPLLPQLTAYPKAYRYRRLPLTAYPDLYRYRLSPLTAYPKAYRYRSLPLPLIRVFTATALYRYRSSESLPLPLITAYRLSDPLPAAVSGKPKSPIGHLKTVKNG